jgi:hypothetical protein
VTAARDLISAEFLKLIKRRGLFWWSLILTVLPVLIVFVVLVILHVVNPDHHDAAGGADAFNGAMEVLGALSALVAVLIGSTAGAGDVGAGVFRDLVTTGRSRLVLFFVRVPGALLMLVPFMAIGYAINIFFTFVFAGDQTTPSVGVVVHYGIWLLVARAMELVMAIGLASLISSRGITIGVLLAWSFALGPIVASIDFLGVFRELVSSAATDALRPVIGDDNPLVGMSLGAAILVVAAYCAVFLALGAWRTNTQDA